MASFRRVANIEELRGTPEVHIVYGLVQIPYRMVAISISSS